MINYFNESNKNNNWKLKKYKSVSQAFFDNINPFGLQPAISLLALKETPSFRQRSHSEENSQFKGRNNKLAEVPYNSPERYLYEFYTNSEFSKFK